MGAGAVELSREDEADVRIGAGEYKGRKLLPPVGMETRPITGRAKKSLFAMLGERLDGQAVVDLYCGTGTLGLEAMSRGAKRCWFAERDRRAIASLRRNIEMLAVAERCTIWSGDVRSRLAGWLATIDGEVDVAFVDPPYPEARRWDWAQIAETIFAPLADSLAPDGQVAVRLPGEVQPPEELGGLAITRSRRYGDMQLVLMEKRIASSE